MGEKMRTEHMTDRMRQRRIVDAEIDLVLELGEWNERTDRLVLTSQACASAEAKLRKEIAKLEKHMRQ